MLLEHYPVYTVGNLDKKNLDSYAHLNNFADIQAVNRGGKITFHGPGQMVVYPIVNLEKLKKDIHYYIFCLEEIVVKVLKDFGIEAGRKAKYTGVWVDNEKICAIGIACKRWISWHGLALNVDVNLDYFDHIVPCGIKEFGTTSLQKLGYTISKKDLIDKFIKYAISIFSVNCADLINNETKIINEMR